MRKPSVMAVAAHCDGVEFCFASTLLKYREKEKDGAVLQRKIEEHLCRIR